MITNVLIFLVLVSAGCKRKEKNTLPLESGTGLVEITPPAGYPRYGYPAVNSTGVLDPLYAKALLFKQGDIQGGGCYMQFVVLIKYIIHRC